MHTRLPGGVLTPPAVDDAGWAAGPSHGYLREYVSYWADGFDWPAQEAALNAPKSTSMPVSRAAADPGAAPRLGRVRAQGCRLPRRRAARRGSLGELRVRDELEQRPVGVAEVDALAGALSAEARHRSEFDLDAEALEVRHRVFDRRRPDEA